MVLIYVAILRSELAIAVVYGSRRVESMGSSLVSLSFFLGKVRNHKMRPEARYGALTPRRRATTASLCLLTCHYISAGREQSN